MSDTETVLREFYDKAYAAGVAAERDGGWRKQRRH